MSRQKKVPPIARKAGTHRLRAIEYKPSYQSKGPPISTLIKEASVARSQSAPPSASASSSKSNAKKVSSNRKNRKAGSSSSSKSTKSVKNSFSRLSQIEEEDDDEVAETDVDDQERDNDEDENDDRSDSGDADAEGGLVPKIKQSRVNRLAEKKRAASGLVESEASGSSSDNDDNNSDAEPLLVTHSRRRRLSNSTVRSPSHSPVPPPSHKNKSKNVKKSTRYHEWERFINEYFKSPAEAVPVLAESFSDPFFGMSPRAWLEAGHQSVRERVIEKMIKRREKSARSAKGMLYLYDFRHYVDILDWDAMLATMNARDGRLDPVRRRRSPSLPPQNDFVNGHPSPYAKQYEDPGEYEPVASTSGTQQRCQIGRTNSEEIIPELPDQRSQPAATNGFSPPPPPGQAFELLSQSGAMLWGRGFEIVDS